MYSRHPVPSAPRRPPRGVRGAIQRGTVDRVFLAQDWIHDGEDEGPSGPVGLFHPPSDVRPIARPPAGPRPTFSVMVPTFRPDGRLRQTLLSVLAQDPGRDAMQIAVVDDDSPGGNVAAVVRGIDPTGRIEVIRGRRRAGLAGNWNRALDAARGHYVHLLHQDDYVLPGFYARIERGFRAVRGTVMAFCRTRIVDGDDRHIKTTSRQRWTAGIVSGWLPRIAERQRVQTPAAVVARDAYESQGGFRQDLCHSLDWEMWVRIAAAGAVWYEPRALAVYRRHPTNESHRLVSSGAVWPDLVQAIELNARRLPAGERERVRLRSVRWYAGSALRTVEKQIFRGELDEAARTLSHLPDLLNRLPGGGSGSAALRRVGRLQQRLRDARRKAA